ncbi:MAG: flagellin [Alphaproteobacteria bacterium]|jgi:flagellin
MPISITSNAAAAVAHRNLGTASSESQRAISKVSSGTRVFNAKEDAAALAIGAGLRKEVSVFKAASVNAQSGISLMQIVDGAIQKMTDILDRMNALAVQSNSEQLSGVERVYLDVEFQTMKEEFDRIATKTEFNGAPLMGGVNEIGLNTAGANVDSTAGIVGFGFQDFVNPASVFEVNYDTTANMLTLTNSATSVSQSISVQSPTVGRLNEYNFGQMGVTLTLNSDFDDLTPIVHAGAGEEFDVAISAVAVAATYEFQVGVSTSSEDRIVVALPLINLAELGLSTDNVLTQGAASIAQSSIEAALDLLNSARSNLGANMNRMEVAASHIQTSMENAEITRSALLDVDVASEITNLTSQQLLIEAGTSMLSSANEQPRVLLGLLR